MFGWLWQGTESLLKGGLFNQLVKDGSSNLKWILYFSSYLLCVIIPYCLGSINNAVIISKRKYGNDIRNFGSGNAGMTNMGRVYGKTAALLTLVGDVSKSAISVIFGGCLLGNNGAYIAGLLCIMGHVFPIFFHFKGGKGVLSAATMILILDPTVFALLIVIFLLVLIVSHFVSLSSVIAAFSYPGIVYMKDNFNNFVPGFDLVFAFFIGLLIILMHRPNLKRIYEREESKFYFFKKNKNKDNKVDDIEEDDDDDGDDN